MERGSAYPSDFGVVLCPRVLVLGTLGLQDELKVDYPGEKFGQESKTTSIFVF